jgi:hypothetical protein
VDTRLKLEASARAHLMLMVDCTSLNIYVVVVRSIHSTGDAEALQKMYTTSDSRKVCATFDLGTCTRFLLFRWWHYIGLYGAILVFLQKGILSKLNWAEIH